MKIKLKTLKSSEIELNIQDNTILVQDLKNQIEKEQDVPSSSIKLIYNGSVLDDKKTLSSYSINENAVIIYMVSKVTKKNEITKTTTEDKNSNIKKEENIKKENNTSDNNIKNNEIKNNTTSSTTNNNPNKYTEQMSQLLEMGFDQAKCLQALSAAKGSVQIAIEYLYNGIPENLPFDNNDNNGSVGFEIDDNAYDNGFDVDADGEGDGNEHLNLNFDNFDLSDPNALTKIASCIKVLISHDPSILQDIMLDLEETNPEILDFIKDNETQFKELMSQEVNEDDFKVAELLGITTNVHHDVDHDDEDLSYVPGNDGHNSNNNNPLSEITKDFNDKDRESIKNLAALGFSEIDAIQAYLACGKNEEMAAEFLFNDLN